MLKNLCQLIALFIIAPFVGKAEEAPPTIYQVQAESIDGHPVSLSAFRGNVLLIVNVASRCGFTGQYRQLQELYETYQKKGFFILGFPSNDFLGQEPDSNQEIIAFCRKNYAVTFPLFAKTHVIGSEMHPLYRFLTNNKQHGGTVCWNFTKFLVDRNGQVINRFGPMTPPDAPQVIQAIQGAL